MRRRPLVPAILRSTAALATALCLTASGLVACDSEPELDPDPIAAHSDDTLRSFDQVAEAIAQDPRFVELLQTSVTVARQQLDSQRQMPPEQLEAHIVTINSPEFAEQVELPEYLALVGIDQALVDHQIALARALVLDHGLAQLSPDQIEDVFEIAASTPNNHDLLAGMIEYELNPIDELPPEEDQCHDVCHAQFVVTTALAIKACIAALAVAAATAGPAALVAVLVAMAAYAWSLYQANEALKNCRAACDGELSSTEECVRDSDCYADEFCWTGVLGWGANECRPLHAEGQVCSRDGQCDTGCCKYHLVSNPISMVCRPASKCS